MFYRPDAHLVTQPTVSKHWRGKYSIPWTCLPQAHLEVFQLCLRPLLAPGYLGEGCHASHQPSDASTPNNRKMYNNNNNNNSRSSIVPYSRSFRGAGGMSDQCSVKALVNKKVLSLDLKTGFSPSKTQFKFKLSRVSTSLLLINATLTVTSCNTIIAVLHYKITSLVQLGKLHNSFWPHMDRMKTVWIPLNG